MQLNLDNNTAQYQIKAYDAGIITINDTTYDQSLIVSPNTLISPWPVSEIQSLETEHLDAIIQLKPEVVLLGTGERLIFPQQELTAYMAKHKLSMEVMNNEALCRTYSVLTSEGRQVVAAIILD